MIARNAVDIIGVPFNSDGTTRGVARGPAALRAAGLIDAMRRAGIDVTDRGDLRVAATTTARDPACHVIAPDSLASMISGVRSRVARSLKRGAFPIVIGGDCPIMLGCLAAIATPDSPVGLVFVDGHEDAWPPGQSVSGEAADMEMGFVLGLTLGDLPHDLRALIPPLRFEDVVVLGPRDQVELRQAGVDTLEGRLAYRASTDVARDPAAAGHDAVARMATFARWWFHVDLDVLATASLAAVDYRQPDGLDWDALGRLSAIALGDHGIAGWDVTIYNPDLDPDGSDAARIIAFVTQSLHHAGFTTRR